jgi:hypothetical protein
MKALEFKFGKEKIQGRETFFSTPEMLKVAVNNIPREGGLNVKEMSTRLRLLKIIEAHTEFIVEEKDFTEALLTVKKTVEFEDADFTKLKELFNEVKWSVVSEFIIELGEALENAKDVKKD